MPVKSCPRERPIIEMFLSAYQNDAWQDASLDWIEERQDGAVEVVATSAHGTKLALEHTLIQPFVGEKFDSEAFIKAFGRIEKNPALILPERHLDVIVPVHSIPKGYDWDEVGEALLTWLIANHVAVPIESESRNTIRVGNNSKNEPLLLDITLRTMSLPGMAGNCLISRNKVPEDLGAVVERALTSKIPKLVKTDVDKRILLLELDQIALSDSQVYGEIVNLASRYSELSEINEIWFANTAILASEGCAHFTFRDGRGLVELLRFEKGILKTRRDDRPHLGPPSRGY